MNTFLLLSLIGTYTGDKRDNDTAFAILSIIATLYNNHVAGSPAGAINVNTATCSSGGTVDISGTTSVSGGETTINLTFVLSNCRENVSGGTIAADLTLNGSVQSPGIINGERSTGGSNISISGTLSNSYYIFDKAFTLNESSCTIGLSHNSVPVHQYSLLASGSICGRAVSY